MDYFALLLPLLLIVGLFAGLILLKRRLFEDSSPAPIPMPESPAAVGTPAAPTAGPAPLAVDAPKPPISAGNADRASHAGRAGEPGVSLSPARLYPCPLLTPAHKTVFARLLKALPGYVVLPSMTYDRFLEAHDGSASENTSLLNRAGGQRADFVVCNRGLEVLLVCEVEDGRQLPARIQERERMLQKAGLRLLRWSPAQPPEADSLAQTVRTLERLRRGATRD